MCNTKKVAIISNAPSPYRVDHYEFLQNKYKEYDFYIIYARKTTESDLRQWTVSTDKLENVSFLSCYMFIKKGKYDDRQIFITHGVGRSLMKIKPDVVVCMEYNPTSLQVMYWCKYHKVPFVSHTDGTIHSERNISFIQKLFRKYIIKNASSFIASSNKAKEKILIYGTDKSIYLSYITADLDKYLSEKDDSGTTSLIFVGSLIERKGIDLLLQALAEMETKCKLLIVGTGNLKPVLKEQAMRLEIDDRITFCGYKQREELVELYKHSDIFVLPTREDCYGLVILEAMCTSLPVVSSKYADGAYDLIEEGKSGYIVDPYNAKEFAHVLDRVLDENGYQNKMGHYAYNKAQEFTFEKVSVGYIEAIREALSMKCMGK